MNDIPDDIRKAAANVLETMGAAYMNPAHVERALMNERERCARIINAECERVLACQDGKDDSVDLNLRLVAVLLPELEAAIRRGDNTDA